ncbi:urease subunit gamma [Halobellus limi]|uniref:Urease subunit gamma n=1 Tax=Halobellus limi TaxID=699433 RepID=A0A1H5WTQ2_9EURY|nr:urease subunit gamma [Halobellus limi]QCC46341.1 urease subunit gamma [Halobellus limi]SEG02834.1 urease subunit gamma [Halobellus limi]
MNLTPKDEERLTVFQVAELARRRKERGVALNRPETIAYISDWMFERAREGWTVAEIRAEATQLLGTDDVMDGVPSMIDTIQVEPVFPDGTKLVTVHDPIRTETARNPGAGGDGTRETDGGDDPANEGTAAGGESA